MASTRSRVQPCARSSLLEEEGRFECAYALRMEVADWLLGARDANLSAPSLS